MATLAELVQELPAELYNNILEYTLTTDNDEIVIGKNYKPPKQLQINRATRAAVMETYYSKTRFVWPHAVPSVFFQYWLDSLVPLALEMISTVRFETGNILGFTRRGLPGDLHAAVKRWMIRYCGKDVFAGLSSRLEHVINFRVVREDRIDWLSLEEMRRKAGALDFDKT